MGPYKHHFFLQNETAKGYADDVKSKLSGSILPACFHLSQVLFAQRKRPGSTGLDRISDKYIERKIDAQPTNSETKHNNILDYLP